MPDKPLTRRNFLQSTSALTGALLAGTADMAAGPSVSWGQTTTDEVGALLCLRLQTEDTVEFQLREYLLKRVPPLPNPKTAAEWTVEQRRLRKHLLEDVILRGWPSEWVDASPKFEDLGLIPSGKGYR